MAVTEIRPSRKKLKSLFDYVENDKKTSEEKGSKNKVTESHDMEQQRGLNIVPDSRSRYISAVNCPVKRAYEHMMLTKKSYGKTDGNTAYHGIQSFEKNEVTAATAHEIGVKTAQRMWGDEYEVLITTHVNTDHIHNHFLLNSVSFRTGIKFDNTRTDIRKLREISDGFCKEYGLSYFENSSLFGIHNSFYWIRKNGGKSKIDQLKEDIDLAKENSVSLDHFCYFMESLGYEFVNDINSGNPSLRAPGWNSDQFIGNLGEDYTITEIKKACEKKGLDQRYMDPSVKIPDKRRKPYSDIIINYLMSDEYETDLVNLFETYRDIRFYNKNGFIDKKTGRIDKENAIPKLPQLRQLFHYDKKISEEYEYIKKTGHFNLGYYVVMKDNLSGKIDRCKGLRKIYFDKGRKQKDENLRQEWYAKARSVTVTIKGYRDDIRKLDRIIDRYFMIDLYLKAEEVYEGSGKILDAERILIEGDEYKEMVLKRAKEIEYELQSRSKRSIELDRDVILNNIESIDEKREESFGKKLSLEGRIERAKQKIKEEQRYNNYSYGDREYER